MAVSSDRAPGVTISWLSGTKLQAVTLDVSKSERHTYDAEITDSPVEEGINETDNVRVKPKVVAIEAILTDYPLSLRGGGIGDAAAVGRSGQIFGQLEELQKAGTRIGLDTGLKFYNSMVIQSMTPMRDKNTRGALRLSFVFKEIRTATSKSVPLPAERKAQTKKTGGKQPTKDATKAETNKSWFTDLDDSTVKLTTGLKKAK